MHRNEVKRCLVTHSDEVLRALRRGIDNGTLCSLGCPLYRTPCGCPFTMFTICCGDVTREHFEIVIEKILKVKTHDCTTTNLEA